MTQTMMLDNPSSQENLKNKTNSSQESSVSPYELIMDQLKTQQIKQNIQSKVKEFNLYGLPYRSLEQRENNIFVIKELEQEQSSIIQWNIRDNISTIKNNVMNSFIVYDVQNSDIQVNQWLFSENLKTHHQNKHNIAMQQIMSQQQKLQQTSYQMPIQYYFKTSSQKTFSTNKFPVLLVQQESKRMSFHHETKPSESTQPCQCTIKKGIDLTKRRSKR